jgi:succinyl-diaminopimelate desuccinylase
MADFPSALELTEALVRFDTINPPGDEQACADHLGRLLEGAGFKVAPHAFAPGRTSLIASLPGRGDKAPICFTGHIDTVPLGSRPWSKDPFAGEVAEGRLYGRGTSDMKAGVAAFVCAGAHLAGLGEPEAGILFVITAGEETGCEGADHMAKAGVLSRAGAIVVAEPSSNYPYIGHKGALWLEVETHGVTAHGSMPEHGENAIYKAAHALTKLEDFDFNIAPHGILGRASLNVGTIEGGLNINSVPDRTAFTIDIRSIPGQPHHEVIEGLGAYLGPEARLRPIMDVEGISTPADHPWMQEVYEIMTPYLGARPEPRGATYFTDAAYLTPAMGNAPTVILGPGEPQMAHQTDEYCLIERIDQAREAFETITRRWCGL